jgi:hypothetical protein
LMRSNFKYEKSNNFYSIISNIRVDQISLTVLLLLFIIFFVFLTKLIIRIVSSIGNSLQ